MAMRTYMRDLMRDQNVSEICIVHDESVSTLPDEDPFLGCSHGDDNFQSDDSFQTRSSQLSDDSSSQESGSFYPQHDRSEPTSSPGSLLGFRERHRRLKETLSPVKVYKWSPAISKENIMVSQSTPTILAPSMTSSGQRRTDNLRSRLTRLASDSNIIDGPPGLTDDI